MEKHVTGKEGSKKLKERKEGRKEKRLTHTGFTDELFAVVRMFTLATSDLTDFISATRTGVTRMGDLPLLLAVGTASW